jgi:hypothetical protein
MYKCSNEFAQIIKEMIDMMFDIEHKTCWMNDETNNHIVFFSMHPNTVKKAKKALDEAGVLCMTKLKTYDSILLAEEINEQ